MGLELEQADPGFALAGGVVALTVDSGELAVDGDGLGGLADLGERAGEQVERQRVGRVGAEEDLQPSERALGVAALEVDLAERAHDVELVGIEVEQPLGDLHVVFVPRLVAQVVQGALELGDRAVVLALAGVAFGEADAVGLVVGAELDDLFEQLEAVGVAPFALVGADDDLELTDRFGPEAELDVELAELAVHVDEGGVGAEDLLVDRDAFEEEAALFVVAGDAVVGRDRLVDRPLADLQVGDAVPDPNVVGIFVDDRAQLADGAVELALLSVPLRRSDDLVLVEGHLRVLLSARQTGRSTPGRCWSAGSGRWYGPPPATVKNGPPSNEGRRVATC